MEQSGHKSLPAWLSHDPSTNTLQGVPTEKDRGTYLMSANGDLFAIEVATSSQNEVAPPASSTKQSLLCKPQDLLTRVMVAVNADIHTLSPLNKVQLISDLSNHLSLSRDHVSLRAEKNGDILDASVALVSGAGDQKRKPLQPVTIMHWVVGCGPVKSHQMETLERLESTAKSGLLRQVLGHGVSIWQVTINKPPATSKRRLKRKIVVTSTPAPGTAAKIYFVNFDILANFEDKI